MTEEPRIPLTTAGREITAEVASQLRTQFLRIKAAVSAERLWTRLLTEEDRNRLGGNLEECYSKRGTAGMWMELRGVSAERAVIEVARELSFLDEPTAKWLLREIGEEMPSPLVTEHPLWQRESGKLRWGGHVIRRVRVMGNRSGIQQILDAFQAAGWPSRIEDPIARGQHAEQVRQIVLSLNKGLELIRFHVQEAGKAITWSRL
jgi:hypothetical protein